MDNDEVDVVRSAGPLEVKTADKIYNVYENFVLWMKLKISRFYK
jgi:hypothetical protein